MLPFVLSTLMPEAVQTEILPETTPKESAQNPAIYPIQPSALYIESTTPRPITSEVTDVLPLSGEQVPGFSISIPKIRLQRGITKNVNPSVKSQYLPVLEQSVAHGSGTALPDQEDGNVYLFAHSQNYYGTETPEGGWFTRIDELVPGDPIYLSYDGEEYTYRVIDYDIVGPEEIDIYTGISSYDGSSSLTLQTCYPRGDTALRLIVYARGE